MRDSVKLLTSVSHLAPLFGAFSLQIRKTSSLFSVTLAQSSQSLTVSFHHNIRIYDFQQCTQKSPHCQCSLAGNRCPTLVLDKPSWYLLTPQVPIK